MCLLWLCPWDNLGVRMLLPAVHAREPWPDDDLVDPFAEPERLSVAEARVSEVLALVGLSKFDRVLPRALSGGMQMRVSIARGLVTEPDLLLMDEPFGALDALTRAHLQDELLKIVAQTQSTVVMVTGMSNTFAALARPTTLFFSVWRSMDCTPNAICGCWSMKMIWLFCGVRTSR
mgnify:CR=1 FL=1